METRRLKLYDWTMTHYRLTVSWLFAVKIDSFDCILLRSLILFHFQYSLHFEYIFTCHVV